MKKILELSLALGLMLTMTYCSEDYGDYGESSRDLSQDIKNIVSDDILNTIEKLGMTIYEGKNPPDITGIFLEEPHTLKASNQENDEIGHVYNAWKFKLFNQNNQNLTISLEYKSGDTTGSSTTSFISGSGDNFSVFLKVISNKDGYTADMVRIISGKISDSGIVNCHIALFMVDDKGDPSDSFISNGTGRILYDSDGLAEVQSEF
jgi:hypothetical protein